MQRHDVAFTRKEERERPDYGTVCRTTGAAIDGPWPGPSRGGAGANRRSHDARPPHPCPCHAHQGGTKIQNTFRGPGHLTPTLPMYDQSKTLNLWSRDVRPPRPGPLPIPDPLGHSINRAFPIYSLLRQQLVKPQHYTFLGIEQFLIKIFRQWFKGTNQTLHCGFLM